MESKRKKISFNYHRFKLAVLTGLMLMLISGWQYRKLAKNLSRPTTALAITPGTLAQIPNNLGKWQGTDRPLSEDVIKALDAADHLNRQYTRHSQTETVELFIVYGSSARDLLPHRPEVCYPGSGWSMRNSEKVQIMINRDTLLNNQETLECKIYYFEKMSLDANAIAVLNYYIIDGQYCEDVSLLKSKAWRGNDAMRYLIQVQISCPFGAFRSSDSATAILKDFARDSHPAIQKIVKNINQQSLAGKL